MASKTLALNPIAWQGGPFTIHWYGVIIATGVILALWLSVREGKHQGIDEDVFYDYLLWALPVAIICARIYYVVFQWPYYRLHPDEIIAIWDGGIAIYGAIIGGLITLLIFCRKRAPGMDDVGCDCTDCYLGPGNWPLGQLYESRSFWANHYKSSIAGPALAAVDNYADAYSRSLPGPYFPV